MLTVKPAETAPPEPTEAPSQTTNTPSRPSHPDGAPFHIIPGLSNFRHIGGWPVVTSPHAPPRHVRRDVLFRGADTNRITPEGEEKLRKLGIKIDFDLRSKQQIEKTGGYKEIPGIERQWTPVFAEEQYTEERARERYELYAGEGTDGIVTAFIEILTAGGPMFRTVLGEILASAGAGSPSSAFFMHCTTGNNRTGVFISMLLLLLGVAPDVVAYEYALSERGLAPTRHINVERLLKKGAFREYGSEEARRKCERMVGAREESMQALVSEVVRRWRGAEGYFREVVGLSAKEIARLREVLTEDEDDEGDLSNDTIERIRAVWKADQEEELRKEAKDKIAS